MSQVLPLPRILSFSQRKRAWSPPHSVSQAESRNPCVVVAVAGLCRVWRPRHPLLQLSPLTRFQGSRMRKGTLLFLLPSWRRLIDDFLFCSGGKFPMCRISLDHMVTHCVYSQARVMVFPVSIMNDLYYLPPFCPSIIPDRSCTLLLVVIIISTNSYTFIPQRICIHDIMRLWTSGHSAGLNIFFGIQPQTARPNPSYGYLISSSKFDSGKVALDSCPRGPEKQILFFLSS